MNDEWIREAWTRNENGNWLPNEKKFLKMGMAISHRCCRICRMTPSPRNETLDPFVLDYGKEYAHQSCLDFFYGNKS